MRSTLFIFAVVISILFTEETLNAQKCYALDFDNTIILNIDNSKVDSKTEALIEEELRLKKKIYFNKEYVYLIEGDSLFLILKYTNQVYAKPIEGDSPFVFQENSNYVSYKNNYKLKEGPFTGNVTGKFCREYVLTYPDEKKVRYIVAVTIPFINFLKLPMKLDGFPLQHDQTFSLDGKEKTYRLTYDVQKVKEPSVFSKAIKKYESEALGRSHKDDCPEAGAAFVKIDKKYIDKINEQILPYPTRFTPPINTFYELPTLTGPVVSVEKRDGDRLEKYVRYNKDGRPELIIECGYSSCDTTVVNITAKDQVNKIVSTDSKQHLRNDTLFKGRFREAIYNNVDSRIIAEYRTYSKHNKNVRKDRNVARKIEKNYNKMMDVVRYGKDSLITHQGTGLIDIRKKIDAPEDCRNILEYHYENKKLVNVYDVNKNENEASLSYYDNGLLRSYHQPDYLKEKFPSTQCYSYTIKKLVDDNVEIQVTCDYLLGGPETTIYRLDHHGNIIYRGSPLTHKNGQRRGEWYFIEYDEPVSRNKIPDR